MDSGEAPPDPNPNHCHPTYVTKKREKCNFTSLENGNVFHQTKKSEEILLLEHIFPSNKQILMYKRYSIKLLLRHQTFRKYEYIF